MSVAENPVTEHRARNQQHQLAFGSSIGAIALLVGLGCVFAGLPMLWSMAWSSMFAGDPDLLKNEFLKEALLILIVTPTEAD